MADFSQFSRFQPARPEPFQKAWFYQDSCNFKRFWSQWLILVSFRGFSLAAQNPSRRHDFTWFYQNLQPMADFTYVCNDFITIYACRWRVMNCLSKGSKKGPKRVQNRPQNRPKMTPPGCPRVVQSTFLVLRAFCVISGSVFGAILGSIFEPKIVKKHVRKSNGKSMPENAENVS